jgi:hypothetical protein
MMRIMAGVRDLVQRTGDGHTGWVLMAGLLIGRVALCAVCTIQVEMRSTGFLFEPQNQGRQFVSGLASKPLGWFVNGLTSKLVVTVSPGLTSKLVAWIKPLGQISLVWPQNRW